MDLQHIKMVVFDMAGTTVDEQNVVYKTLQKAINEFGVEVGLDTVLEFGAGKEKHQAIKDILKHQAYENIEDSEVIFTIFKTMLDDAYKTLSVRPVEGVQGVIAKLKEQGVIVVLNTGYNAMIANLLLDKMKWRRGAQYDMLITADDVEKGRPHPDMIEKAMQAFNIEDPSTVLKAGDSAIDIEEGKNANCGITIGVLSGAQTREQLEDMEPTYVISSLASLLENN